MGFSNQSFSQNCYNINMNSSRPQLQSNISPGSGLQNHKDNPGVKKISISIQSQPPFSPFLQTHLIRRKSRRVTRRVLMVRRIQVSQLSSASKGDI